MEAEAAAAVEAVVTAAGYQHGWSQAGRQVVGNSGCSNSRDGFPETDSEREVITTETAVFQHEINSLGLLQRLEGFVRKPVSAPPASALRRDRISALAAIR